MKIPNHLLPRNLKDRKALEALEDNEISTVTRMVIRSTRGGGSQAPIPPQGNPNQVAPSGGEPDIRQQRPPVNANIVAGIDLNIRPIGQDRRRR